MKRERRIRQLEVIQKQWF